MTTVLMGDKSVENVHSCAFLCYAIATQPDGIIEDIMFLGCSVVLPFVH